MRHPDLAQLITTLRQTHGRDVSIYDESFLAKMLARRLGADESAAAYLNRLTTDRAEADAFSESLKITYSDFFRNPLTFAILEQLVLPALVEAGEKSGREKIRIWSAGCASGQEAWSVAILLDELLAARGSEVRFQIIATDNSETELAAARSGAYFEDAMQNVRMRHLREYFSREGETCVVQPRLRERVDFSAYDLLDEHSSSPPAGIFGDFDLIFCSNLLFYYSPERRRFILNKVRRDLSPNGYLVTGEAERVIVEQTGGFRAVAPPAAVFQKSDGSFHHG